MAIARRVTELAGLRRRSRADEAMERYADGDDAAFSVLYDELAPRVVSLCAPAVAVSRQRGGHRPADVAPDARRSVPIRGAAVLPWAYAIARRLTIDVCRRPDHDPRVTPEGFAVESQSVAASPEEALHRRRSEAALERDVARLPGAWREAFELLKVDGLSASTAAEVLGVTPGTVKIRATGPPSRSARHRRSEIKNPSGSTPMDEQTRRRPTCDDALGIPQTQGARRSASPPRARTSEPSSAIAERGRALGSGAVGDVPLCGRGHTHRRATAPHRSLAGGRHRRAGGIGELADAAPPPLDAVTAPRLPVGGHRRSACAGGGLAQSLALGLPRPVHSVRLPVFRPDRWAAPWPFLALCYASAR